MSEPNIIQDHFIEELVKQPDGSFIRENQIVRARNGTTFDEHLADFDEHLAEYESLRVITSIVSAMTNVPAGQTRTLTIPLGKIPKKYVKITEMGSSPTNSFVSIHGDLEKFIFGSRAAINWGDSFSLQTGNRMFFQKIELIGSNLIFTANNSHTADQNMFVQGFMEVM